MEKVACWKCQHFYADGYDDHCCCENSAAKLMGEFYNGMYDLPPFGFSAVICPKYEEEKK